MEYFCDTCNLWLSHLSLKATTWKERLENVLTNVQKNKSCQRLCQKSCLWANQRGFFGGVIMNIWRWEESCHNSLTLALPDPGDLFWLAAKPLHRGCAEKHGWPVGLLDLARLRETQSIFPRVVVWSYFLNGMRWVSNAECTWVQKRFTKHFCVSFTLDIALSTKRN